MTGWLAGKRFAIEGDALGIEAALTSQGAQVVADPALADILIHVAFAGPQVPAHEMGHGEWRARLDAELDRRFLLARDFAAAWREREQCGAILFVGSPECAGGADHAAAAGALGNLTKTLGVEWARDGVRVNTILTTSHGETLGHLAAYLVSDYAAYVTGAVMGVGIDD